MIKYSDKKPKQKREPFFFFTIEHTENKENGKNIYKKAQS